MFTKTIHLFSSGAQRGEKRSKKKKKKMGNFQRANNKFGKGERKRKEILNPQVWRETERLKDACMMMHSNNRRGVYMCTVCTYKNEEEEVEEGQHQPQQQEEKEKKA